MAKKKNKPAIIAEASERTGGNVRTNPTHNEIAEAAYHRYLKREGSQGSDFDDWLEAERELRSRVNPKFQ